MIAEKKEAKAHTQREKEMLQEIAQLVVFVKRKQLQLFL